MFWNKISVKQSSELFSYYITFFSHLWKKNQPTLEKTNYMGCTWNTSAWQYKVPCDI